MFASRAFKKRGKRREREANERERKRKRERVFSLLGFVVFFSTKKQGAGDVTALSLGCLLLSGAVVALNDKGGVQNRIPKRRRVGQGVDLQNLLLFGVLFSKKA